MRRINRLRHLVVAVAAAGALGLTAGPAAHAAPITDSGSPVATQQPSLGLTYLVRTLANSEADLGQVVAFAGSYAPGGYSVADGQLLPNLAGRVATGAGLPSLALGEVTGASSTTLSVGNLPPQALTTANGKTSVFGGGQAFSLWQPSLALHYIIAVQGVFPTETGIVPDSVPFLGEVSLYAGAVAPAGWDFADGQLLSVAANQALFAVLGDTYGGNGIADFALPNLQGRVAVGTGDGGRRDAGRNLRRGERNAGFRAIAAGISCRTSGRHPRS
jgi:microcystin-dependent protein